jgi:folate-binding protein YgfZ
MSHLLPTESLFLDLSDRAKLRLKGADRVRFLNGQVSNDVRRATSEESVYTGVMTIKGKLCGDAYVHAEGESFLLDAEPDLREPLLARLERYIIADDVELSDETDERGLLHLLDFLAGASEHPAHTQELLASLNEAGENVQVVRSSRFGQPGLDLFCPAAACAGLRSRVHAAGFTLLNEDGAESLRISAGVPRWGAELDENTLPAEARIEERAVSYTKGCYIGQEVVSRVKSVGHVNRLLCGFRALDASPLFPGMMLFASADDAAASAGAKPVGRLTSAACSAGHGGAAYLALGYVRRGWDTTDTRLFATMLPDSTDADVSPPCEVAVSDLPFH